ncbi:hypothetical protein [Thalassotalea euphylliae]|uniref:PEP-CTERM sorting domain-containing protein n=1 Tax=Thalassotalea euphylliae TaxID=1655234 RepID=A0A3E0U729_9GAMM|nr:hypothetical protein [Thalassotalea euphylliae]REL31945.1 hypothetical protein DXX94_15145 [Thalassotalea euphylliae]
MKSVFKSLFLMLLAPVASANLLVNGSFDDTGSPQEFQSVASAHASPGTERYLDTLDVHKNWGIFTGVPGWSVIQGDFIEVLHTGADTDADGNNFSNNGVYDDGDVKAHTEGLFVELDLDQSINNQSINAAIGQTLIDLMIGATYEIEFYYQPRTDIVDDNGIAVSWFDGDLTGFDSAQSVLEVDGEADTWQLRTDIDDNGWLKYTALVEATSSTMSIAFAGQGGVNGRGGFIDSVSVTKVPLPATSLLLLTLIPLIGRFRK